MTAKFYPKAALFETKSQVMGNWIVFHRELSDAAKILIFALNGIFTCTHSWVPVQCDLQKRLGWGKEKMRNTIKECESEGFLRVTQKRHKSGEFACHDFEFCIDASFKEKSMHSSQEKPAHNESEPETGLRCPDNRNPDNQPLPCSKEQPCLKEQQQTEQVLPEAVVVVSSCEEKGKQMYILLKPFGLDVTLIASFAQKYPLERITDAIASYEAYSKENEVFSVSGYIRMAIENGWKPNMKSTPIEEETKEKERSILMDNLAFAGKMIAKFTNTDFYCGISGQFLTLGPKEKRVTVDLSDENAQNIIIQYLKQQGKL